MNMFKKCAVAFIFFGFSGISLSKAQLKQTAPGGALIANSIGADFLVADSSKQNEWAMKVAIATLPTGETNELTNYALTVQRCFYARMGQSHSPITASFAQHRKMRLADLTVVCVGDIRAGIIPLAK